MASKNEILRWLNELQPVPNMDALHTGTLLCQICEHIFPGSIPQTKVLWKASQEIDFIKNFKLIDEAFHKNNLSKPIDVQALSKSKYLDILDLAQFLKGKFDKMTEKKPFERRVIVPTVRRTLKENVEPVTHSHVSIKRHPTATSVWRKKIVKKNPTIEEIVKVLEDEQDNAAKAQKIKELFE